MAAARQLLENLSEIVILQLLARRLNMFLNRQSIFSEFYFLHTSGLIWRSGWGAAAELCDPSDWVGTQVVVSTPITLKLHPLDFCLGEMGVKIFRFAHPTLAKPSARHCCNPCWNAFFYLILLATIMLFLKIKIHCHCWNFWNSL